MWVGRGIGLGILSELGDEEEGRGGCCDDEDPLAEGGSLTVGEEGAERLIATPFVPLLGEIGADAGDLSEGG